MNTFELNKIAGALLMALLVTTVIGHLGNILVHPKMPAQNAYVVAGVGAEAKGGTQTAAAPAALAPIAPLLAAANPEAGKAFIDWALSKETQELAVQELGRRPIRTDVAPSGDLKPMSEIELIDYDITWAAENRDAFIEKWNELLLSR